MGRALVEGRVGGIVTGSFPDTDPVVILPAPAAPVLYREINLPTAPQGGNTGQLQTAPSMIYNADTGASSDHLFNAFLRGDGVPGGELPILNVPNAFDVGELESGYIPIYPDIILPGQTFELEMQEAVVANEPVFVTSFDDVYVNDLLAQGKRKTQIAAEFSLGSDFVLAGPVAGDGIQVRQVQFLQTELGWGNTLIQNLDAVAHNMTVTLTTPEGDIVLANDASVDAGLPAFAASGSALPGTIHLLPGYLLTISTATATDTRVPAIVGSYTDIV